jgi:endonuclease/exonuclease/phosphatase family metal-dependent hydrolase
LNFVRGVSLFIFITTAAATAQALTVGTQNLYHWMTGFESRLEALDKEMTEEGLPEIIGVQEAALRPWGKKSIYNEFVEKTGYVGEHKVTNNFVAIQEGIALVSKDQGFDCVDLELPATRAGSRQWYQSCKYHVADGAALVINAHTSPGIGPFAKKSRTAQVKAMCDFITQQDSRDPVIILGDLNDVYKSSSFDCLKKMGFVDVLNGEGETYVHGKNPYVKYKRNVRLDYIFYRPTEFELISADFMFHKNLISDHYGLKAELKFR